jgi:hypothetical protein
LITKAAEALPMAKAVVVDGGVTLRYQLSCAVNSIVSKQSNGSNSFFNFQPWINRRRKHLSFSYQLNRERGCRNCPWPDAVENVSMVASAV